MKSNLADLGIFGGTPEFDRDLHVGRPNIGDRQALLKRINDLLDRRWLTNDGPLLQEFEQRICQLIGVKHCVGVCNATIGLEILEKAIVYFHCYSARLTMARSYSGVLRYRSCNA